MTFSARLDAFAKVTTLAVGLVLAVVSSFFIFLAQQDGRAAAIAVLSLASLIPVSIFVATYLYAPLAYDMADNALIVRRRLSPVIIPYSEILKVELVNETFVQDLDRTGGNGGVFGYYGEFRAGRDTYLLYVTRMRDTVLVSVKDGRRVILSPDDHSFVNRLRERIQTLAG